MSLGWTFVSHVFARSDASRPKDLGRYMLGMVFAGMSNVCMRRRDLIMYSACQSTNSTVNTGWALKDQHRQRQGWSDQVSGILTLLPFCRTSLWLLGLRSRVAGWLSASRKIMSQWFLWSSAVYRVISYIFDTGCLRRLNHCVEGIGCWNTESTQPTLHNYRI